MATGNNNTQAAFLACRSNWPLCLAGQAWARLRASHPHLPHHHLVFSGSLPLPGLKEQWPPFLSLLFHGCWKFNPPSAHIFLVITIWGTGRTKNIFLRGFSYAMSPIELDFGHVASFFLFHLLLFIFWSCSVVCGILVPWLGIKPTSSARKQGFLTTGPQGSSQVASFFGKLFLHPFSLLAQSCLSPQL